MMGEVGTIQAAALMVELSQVSEQQLFTHHAMSAEKLIAYFRNALLRTGTYSDERMAQEQVMEAVDIHVLCEKDVRGNRYVKEISEIAGKGEESYCVLYRYEDGVYKKTGVPSRTLLCRMTERLGQDKKEKVFAFFTEV